MEVVPQLEEVLGLHLRERDLLARCGRGEEGEGEASAGG